MFRKAATRQEVGVVAFVVPGHNLFDQNLFR